MSNDTVVSLAAPAQVSDPLTELLRSGARRLIEAAVSAEFEEYLSGFVQAQLPDGRRSAEAPSKGPKPVLAPPAKRTVSLFTVRCAPLAENVTFTTRFQQRHAAQLNSSVHHFRP